jgi:3-phosphoshikimate 1-carboxyvinyltransferase
MTEIGSYEVMGEKHAPVSKSHMQREILLSLLADEKSTLTGNFTSLPSDVMDALDAIQKLGASWVLNENTLQISPPKERKLLTHLELHVGESGFLFRSLLPLGYLFAKRITFHARGTLQKRTTESLVPSLVQFGCTLLSEPNAWPFVLQYPNTIGEKCVVDASQTSQMASGFLMLAATLPSNLAIELMNPTSKPYLELTMEGLANRGVKALRNEEHYVFEADGKPLGKSVEIQGDWSGAANVLVAAAIRGDLQMKGLSLGSRQADEHILEVLKSYGAELLLANDSIGVRAKNHFCFQVNVTNCPDLFPLVCVLAASADGQSEISGIHRLYNKESNRFLSSCALLNILGVAHEVSGDAMRITGGVKYGGGEVASFDDHRIVFATYVARMLTDVPIGIDDIHSIKKSYPSFVSDL